MITEKYKIRVDEDSWKWRSSKNKKGIMRDLIPSILDLLMGY